MVLFICQTTVIDLRSKPVLSAVASQQSQGAVSLPVTFRTVRWGFRQCFLPSLSFFLLIIDESIHKKIITRFYHHKHSFWNKYLGIQVSTVWNTMYQHQMQVDCVWWSQDPSTPSWFFYVCNKIESETLSSLFLLCFHKNSTQQQSEFRWKFVWVVCTGCK